MPYCSSCGTEIQEGVKFCPSCGSSVAPGRDQPRQPHLIKCPNCGQELSSFQGNCPACGYEIRNVAVSNAIKQFSENLSEIEKRAPQANFEKSPTTDASAVEAAALIRNYIVPNSREDLFEFMIIAHSHINGLGSLKRNNVHLLNAWEAKVEQVYEKGRLTLPKSDFKKLEEFYLAVKDSLRNQRKIARKQTDARSTRGAIGVVIGIIVTVIATFDAINSGNASLLEVLSLVILCIALPVASDKSRSLIGIVFCCAATLASFICSRALAHFGENGSWLFLQFLICFSISLFQFIRFLVKKPTEGK